MKTATSTSTTKATRSYEIDYDNDEPIRRVDVLRDPGVNLLNTGVIRHKGERTRYDLICYIQPGPRAPKQPSYLILKWQARVLMDTHIMLTLAEGQAFLKVGSRVPRYYRTPPTLGEL